MCFYVLALLPCIERKIKSSLILPIYVNGKSSENLPMGDNISQESDFWGTIFFAL